LLRNITSDIISIFVFKNGAYGILVAGCMLEGVAGSGQDPEHWMEDQSSPEGQRSVGQDSDPEERLNFPDQQAGHL